MADKPAADRTEQPTPKRISKAREKGKVAQSKELASAVSIFVLLMSTFLMAGPMNQWFTKHLVEALSCDTQMFADSGAFASYISGKIISLIVILLPFLIAMSVAVIVANVAVGGVTFTAGAIELKLSAINPVSGMSNLINTKTMVDFLLSVVKLFFVGMIVWVYMRNRLDEFMLLRWAWSFTIFATIGKLIFSVTLRICLALFVVGIVDTVYQKWKYIEDMKMTKQEVKEERKQTEGSPEVKSRIRRLQLEAARKRMLQEVPKATVVLVNPTHYAVAIKYDSKQNEAPVLLAKGADHMAEQIKQIARAYGVPVISRPELTRSIYSTVKPGQMIPEMLYVAVAEVLAVVYRIKRQRR